MRLCNYIHPYSCFFVNKIAFCVILKTSSQQQIIHTVNTKPLFIFVLFFFIIFIQIFLLDKRAFQPLWLDKCVVEQSRHGWRQNLSLIADIFCDCAPLSVNHLPPTARNVECSPWNNPLQMSLWFEFIAFYCNYCIAGKYELAAQVFS